MDTDLLKTRDLEAVVSRILALRREGKKIVFTNGCFDLLHAGHILSIRQARGLGDVLVVGLNSDDSVRRLKGPDRPAVPLARRKAMLEALEWVDFVIPFEEDTPRRLLEAIRPDVLAKGGDWKEKGASGADFVRSYGGVVCYTDYEPGVSTTALIEKERAAGQREDRRE